MIIKDPPFSAVTYDIYCDIRPNVDELIRVKTISIFNNESARQIFIMRRIPYLSIWQPKKHIEKYINHAEIQRSLQREYLSELEDRSEVLFYKKHLLKFVIDLLKEYVDREEVIPLKTFKERVKTFLTLEAIKA